MKIGTKASLIVLFITLVTIIFTISAIVIVNLPWITLGVGAMFEPNPLEPIITYGEFPFELVYSIKGETITVQDTIICEYDGVGFSGSVGKYRKWNMHLKSDVNKTELVLIEDDEIKVCCTIGSAEHYMGEENHKILSAFTPRVFIKTKATSGKYYETASDALRVINDYDVKLISWKFSDPIENTFN